MPRVYCICNCRIITCLIWFFCQPLYFTLIWHLFAKNIRCLINKLWLLSCEFFFLFLCPFKITLLDPLEFSVVALRLKSSPVGWGCWIHQLHLCRRVRPPLQQVSQIWHQTIWWWGFSNAGALGNAPSLPLLPGSLWLRIVGPVRVLSVDQIELFDI